MNRQHGHIRGRDAADAQGLPQTAGIEFRELLLCFVAQADDPRIIRGQRDQLCLQLGEPLDFAVLAGDVAFVFDANFQTLGDVGGDEAASCG